MSKISNVILMLDYLNTGKKYTIKELSKKLGVSERMIKYYKEQLEEAGIYIDSFMGSNGGYFLTKNISPYNKFNKYDIDLLENANKNLHDNNFEFVNEFDELIEKVKKINDIEKEKSKFLDELDENDKNMVVNYIEKAINNRERICIIYKNISGISRERYIHPLLIFKYDSKIYVTAFCELRNAIRHFSLDRISIKNSKKNKYKILPIYVL